MAKNSVVDPAARDKYLLQVTAGPCYDPNTHQDIPVNGPDNTIIESGLVTCYLKVRIKDYHGLPHGSPSSSPYFEHPLHTSDRYSIAFSFVPKKDLPGNDMVMGFDYDHSIKHQLPPGFKYAMKIATSMLDPGLYSDAYCDEPYLYGPALSGLFTLNIGERTDKVSAEDQVAQLSRDTCGVVEEGASGSGTAIRSSLSIPPKWKKRRKHFLDPAALAHFTFEKGRMYHADFFNPHLDFANFSLRLPGFSISVARYIDEKTHHLRFVLKDRKSGEVCFVVFFKLLFGEELQATLEAKKGENEKREGTQIEQVGSCSNNEGRREQGLPVRDENATTSASSDSHGAPENNKVEHEKHEAPSSASSAIASLSNNITAAFVAMGLWDDASSSSASEKPGDELEARVDEIDDATVERYLQSRHGSTDTWRLDGERFLMD